MPDKKPNIDLFKIAKDINNRGNIKDATGISDNMRKESNIYLQDKLDEYNYLNQGSYTQTSLGLDDNEFEKRIDKGISLSPYFTQNEINKIKADNQSVLEQTGNALMRIGLGELVLGTIGGFFNIVDGVLNSFTGSYTWQDPIAKFFNEKKEELDNAFEIYRKNPNKSFDVTDFGWWADNSVSIASTLSLMLPAAGWAKGLSWLGKATSLSKVTNTLSKSAAKASVKVWDKLAKDTLNTSNKISKLRSIEGRINKWDKLYKDFAGATGMAALSRAGENQIEANSVYDIVYSDSLENIKGMIESDKANGTNEYEKFLENNPELKGLSSIEEMANVIANDAATKTFKGDWAMILSDILQFRAVGGLASRAMKRITTPRQRISAENIKRTLGGAKPEELIKNNFINRRKESFKHILKHPASIATNLQLTEGIEEIWQGVYTEKGFETAQKYFDPNMTPRSINSYLKDLEIWEQGFWGALGGIAFGAGAKQYYNIKDYIHEVKNKKKMSAEDFEMWKKSRDSIKQLDHDKTIAEINKLVDDITTIENGKNPYTYQTNDVTGETKLGADGKPIAVELTEEEKDELIDRTNNEFIDNKIISSINDGSYELIKDILKSKQLDKYLHDKGVRKTASEKLIADSINERIDYVGGLYRYYLNEVEYNNIEHNNPFVTMLTASQLTREKMNIDTTQTKLDNVRKVINTTKTKEANAANVESNDVQTVIDNYHNDILINNIARHIIKLDERINKLDKLVKDKTISKEAAILYKQDYEKEKDNLQNIIEDTTLKTKLDELVKNTTDINLLKNLNITTDKTDNISLSKELKDLIKTETNLQITLAQLNSSFNANSEGFKSRYNEIAQAHDTFVKNKIQDYFNILANYINKASHKDSAYDRLIKYDKNDPNYPIFDKKVREALEVIRYGYINQVGDLGTNSMNYMNNKIRFEQLLKEVKDTSKTNAATLNQDPKKTEFPTEVTGKTVDNTLEQTLKQDKDPTPQTYENPTNLKEDPTKQIGETYVPVVDTSSTGELPQPLGENLEDESLVFPNGVDTQAEPEQNPGVDLYTIQDLIKAELAPEISRIFINSSEDYTNKLVEGTKEYEDLVEQLKTKVQEVLIANNITNVSEDDLTEQALRSYIDIIQNFSKYNDRYLRYAKLLMPNNYNSIIDTLSEDRLNDILEMFNNFIIEYAKSKKLKQYDGKYIIRIDELFNDIIKDTIHEETITTDKLINLYNVVSIIVNKVTNNNAFKNIKLTGVNKFNAMSARQYIDLLSKTRALHQREIAKQLHIDFSDIYKIQDPNLREVVSQALLNKNQIIAEIENDKKTNIANTISFYVYYRTSNGKLEKCKIGALRCVSKNATNTKITTNNHVTGFAYNIDINPDGSFVLDTDEFFNSLFTDENKELLDKLIAYRVGKTKIYANAYSDVSIDKNERDRKIAQEVNDLLTEEDINNILNNPQVKKLLDNNIFKFTKQNAEEILTDREKVEQLINTVNNILFYEKDSLVRETIEEDMELSDSITANINTIRDSYNVWRTKVFQNYNQTYELQKAIEETQEKKIKLKLDVDIIEVPNLVSSRDQYQDIGEKGLAMNITENPIVGVSSNKMQLVDENGEVFGDITPQLPFSPNVNQIGFFIGKEEYRKQGIPPTIAYLIRPNNLFETDSTNNVARELANAFKVELTNIITQFLNTDKGGISFDELSKRLNALLNFRNGIFSSRNIKLIQKENSNAITLIIGDDTNKRDDANKKDNIAITFYKTNNDGTTSKTISVAPKGFDTDPVYIGSRTIRTNNTNLDILKGLTNSENKVDPNLINGYIIGIIESNINNLIINNSLEVLRKDSMGETYNYLVHKSQDKAKVLTMTLGSETFTFNGGIGSLLIDTNAYKTNVSRIGENGSMSTSEVIFANGGFIADVYRETGKEKQAIDKTDKINSTLDEVRNTGKEFKRNNILYISKEYDTINLLAKLGVPQPIIDILTNQQDLGILTPKTTVEVRPKNARKQYNETARYERRKDKIVLTQSGLLDIAKDTTGTALIRNLLHENIHRKLNELKNVQIGKLSRYDIINNELESIYEAFKSYVEQDTSELGIKLKEQILDVLENNYKNDKRTKLEEFLAESLTQKVLMDYLNGIDYKRQDNTIEYETEKKSIFQKIIDVILKIFGIENITSNSILAEEYRILGDILEKQNNNEINSVNNNSVVNTKSPVEEEIPTEEQPASNEIPKEKTKIKRRKLSGVNSVEDLNESKSLTTTIQGTTTEIKLEYSENNRFDNPYGVTFVDRMNTMANRFNKEYKDGINAAIENNDFNYSCK